MSAGSRKLLAWLGVTLVLLGIGALAVVVVPGPQDLADWMGKSCAHELDGEAEQCTIADVIELLWVGPILILVGLVLVAGAGASEK